MYCENNKAMAMTRKFSFWRRWLIVATLCFMAFSLGLVLAPNTTRQVFSLLIYATPESINAFGSAAVAYISLVHAVLGAVMFGWGVALLFIVLGPFKRMSLDAWQTFAVSLTAWFIPDTAYSLWSGFWQNAVFNAVFITLFAIPLVATYGACRKHSS
jgi:phosphate/sulfate permease